MVEKPPPIRPVVDATSEGARARAEGRSRQDCPYPPDSEERHEWFEGYDGTQTEGAPLVAETKKDADRT